MGDVGKGDTLAAASPSVLSTPAILVMSRSCKARRTSSFEPRERSAIGRSMLAMAAGSGIGCM